MSADSQPPSGYKLCPQCRQIYAASVELCPRDHARLIIERRIIVGKYILLNRLGSSPGSEVYAAEQPQLGRMVAIKLLPHSPELESHFDSQVRSIGTVKHEHVVTLYDSGRADDGRLYLAMEYLEGETVAERLVRSGAMAVDRALILWRQSVSAVAAAHRRHVVHGDVNPTNLFLTQRESDAGLEEIVKVIDFHLGARPAPDADPERGGAGLIRYVAPELLHGGAATTRSDVYALGLVLIELLNGRLPPPSALGGQEEISQALLQQLGQSLAVPKPLSGELLTLIGEVLRRDPVRRPTDAGALLQLIRKLPEVGRLPPSSAGVRVDEPDGSASVSSPPSQSTEPDGLAGAKKRDAKSASGAARPLPATGPEPSVPLLSDSFVTPDMGVAHTDEPEWLTGTVEQKVTPRVGMMPATAMTGPTLVAASTPEEHADPFFGSETPQMGVAVLNGLLKQIQEVKDREHRADPVAVPVPAVAVAVAVPKVTPGPHWSRIFLRIFLVVLLFGGLGGGLALFARFKWPLSSGSIFATADLAPVADGFASGGAAPVTDLRPVDLTVSIDATALSQADARAVDLEASADAASDKSSIEPGAIKIRFLYDEDSVTSIECNQESLSTPSSADKHGAGVEAFLRPGGFCRASGPYGSKTYKYDTLVQKRPDASGVLRVRIRMNEPGDGDPPVAKKSPEAARPVPLPRPPVLPSDGGS